MDNAKAVFSKNLANYLNIHNVSRKELGDYLGVSQMAISKWINEHNYPDIEIIIKICEYFKITLNDLFDFNNQSEFNEHEKRLIYSYRDKPNVREAIDVLLNINNEKK